MAGRQCESTLVRVHCAETLRYTFSSCCTSALTDYHFRIASMTRAKTSHHIRPMVFDDLPACVDVSASAFIDDELYAMINPHRQKYPLAWRYWCSSRMRRRFVAENTWGFVCFNTTSTGAEEITGYCMWTYTLEGAGSTMLDLNGDPKPDIASPPIERNHQSFFYTVERLRARLESIYNEHPLSPYCNPAGKRAPLSLLSLKRSFGLAPSPSVLQSLAEPSSSPEPSVTPSPVSYTHLTLPTKRIV